MSAGPEILFARDGLPRLAARLGELGTRRALILAAPSRRFVDRATAALAAYEPAVFDGAKVHVPRDVVDAADARLAEARADTLVAVGGGAAVGLGKALRLSHDVRFAAVPTTYAGSEMTSMYGITSGNEKTTGRDPRVRPDLVLYDATLSATLPVALTVQSLLNGLAHVASVLSTGSLDGDDRARALDAAVAVDRAIDTLHAMPTSLDAREAALRAASAAGLAADRGRFGAQHALAHLLGGGLGLDHAALHAVLLPHFLHHLATASPEVVAALAGVLGTADVAGHVHDLLVRAGAPVSLDALGADPAAVERLVATRPELPARIARDAQRGRRPGA